MTPHTENQEHLRRYLLGNLSPEIQQRLEERLLIEDGLFEELLLSEDELTDDYLTGNLSDDDRLKFEQHFLSTQERQQKLRFAMALSRYVTNAAASVGSQTIQAKLVTGGAKPTWAERFRALWSQPGLALGSALAVAALVLIAVGVFRPSTFFPQRPQSFATITLNLSDSTRAVGVQATKVKLPLATDALKISLTLPEQARAAGARYRVQLLTSDGESKNFELAEQGAQTVSVVIPAAELARGEYALQLFITRAGGAEERISGSYFFTVE